MKGLISFLKEKNALVPKKRPEKAVFANKRLFFSEAKQRPELKTYSDTIKDEIKALIAGY